MMPTIRLFKILIIALFLIQSCNLQNGKNSKIENDKKINDTSLTENQIFNFIDYDSVILALKYKVYRNINYKYNLVYILLLDTAEIELIKSQNPELIKEYREYPSVSQLSDFKVGFYSAKANIRDIFNNSFDQKRIIESLSTEDSQGINIGSIERTVHVKEDKAIFEISGGTWSDTYMARLHNNFFQINFIGGYIE
jgi:hypothetical protein